MRNELPVIGQQSVAFVEVPGILLIRLMSRCNEKCVFCMVAEEIATSDDVDFDEAKERILRQPPGTLIELFGGEPTVYPRFLELLTFAREQGYPCSIASNVRIFHSAKFTQQVARLGPEHIYIRTSLYGDTESLHDYYTASPGSFKQTVQGIENIVAAGFMSQVNIVILKQNVERLEAMTRLVHGWGVPRIKYGNLIFLSTCAQHAIPLSSVTPQLLAAIAVAEDLGLRVTVEKTPICAIDGRIDLLSTERMVYGANRAYDGDGECDGCLVRRWCDGLDPDYVTQFGYDGIRRMTSIPARVIKGTPAAPGDPELLKTHCIAVEHTDFDEPDLRALAGIARRVEAQNGSLAVFPRRFLRT